ncbi:MAG: PKD domain-containing protein [Pseudomonadota bacterium]
MDINPSSWDVFDAPIVELSYRIPAGTPVGLDVNVSGFGRVFVAGTASALPGTYLPVDPITLIDDDQWHTVTIDLYNRVLVASPSSTAITELEWYTANNAPDGSQFWFDDVRGYRRTVETGFTSSLLPDTGATGRGLDALDVNNDGNADIVRAINNGTVSLYLGDGAGNFTTSVAGDPGNDPYALALGDFDSDELVDFFAMNSSSGDAYFFKGNGDGTFQAGVLTPSLDTNNLGAYASFDFNLDGNLDMAVVDWTSDNLWYYPGNGDATFGERVQIGNIPGNVLGVSAPAGRVLGQPTAQGDLDQDVINENGTVNFDGGTSTDDGTIVSWDWDFGDGNTASGQNVSNTFTDEGVYTVVLTVTDEDGQTDRRAFVVTVLGDFPVSDPGGPYTVTEASASNGNWSLIVDGSASSDSDTSIAEYQWDLDSSDGIQIDATGAMALLNYNAAGVYTVTLTVFDEVGQSTSATTTVTVEAGALPVAGLTGPGVVDETTASLGEYAATYDLSSSSDDVGITNFEIDWGDGDTTQINAITDNFNDGDFTNGQEWTQSSSSVWEVVDGQLHYPETVGAWRWLQVLNQSYSDFQLEVDFMATDTGRDGYLGISFHGSPTSANTNTFLMYSRNSWDFWRFYDWRTSTTLVDEGDGWDPGIWYHLRLVVIGNRMQLYVTPEGGVETLQAEAVDPSHRNGVIGLLSFDQVLTYDNVKVTPINEGLRPTHLYDTPGDYPVTLTVTDNAGQTDTAVVNTTVTPNDPPAADAGGPYVLTEADAVNGIWTLQVDASNSTDDVNVQRYEYDFGDGNSHTTGFAQGFSGSYFATGTDLYGFGIPDASVGRVIAIEDGTFVELIDLETDAVIATRSLNRFQTWNSVDTDGLYFKLRSNKPVAAYLTDFADHAAFMPSVGNSPVGREFISYHDINDGFYIYAFEDAVVRIFDTSGNLDAEATLEAGSYWEPSTALISGQVYRVLASGNIAMQTHGNDSYTTVPSSTGAAAGQLFYFATPSGASGSFAAFAYDAADVNVFDLDTDELLYTNSLAAGDTWFETGLTQRRLRVESTGDIEVWGGAVESQTTIEWLGDDTSFTTGRNGTEFYLHNLTDGIAIFAPNNDTQINIDAGDIVTTLNRDDFLALAPEDFPSGSGTHMITSSQPIIIQTLGATTGFNSEGTYLGGLAARHGYAATGTYTLTVTAIDNAGQQTQATTTVEVTVGDPPVPVIDAPAVVDENSANNGVWTVDFDASGSTDDFGIFSYEWDFGDGNTGTGVTTSHGYTAPGVYTVTLTVTDLGGQQTVTTMMITVTGNNGPMADAGGPYVYGEEAASFGQWTATLDGTGSTDDVGLNTYVWTFDPELDDDFAGTVLDTGTWTGTDDVTQNDSITVIGTGSWGNRYLVSNENFGRGGGLVFEAQVRRVNPSGSATAMFGLKNAGNTNFSFSELIYGIYFNATSVQVYEDGSNRGTFATLVPETLYDLRITAKPFQGALYEMREAGTAEWMVLYESEHSIESGLRHHTVVNRGEFEIDNARITAQEVGPVVNRSFDTPGTYGATLTVTDNALQANSDSTTITFTPGDAPVADAGGPYTVEVGALLNFNGTGSSDDNAIQQYEWLFGDTTGGPADANLPYSGRGPTPRHFYHATGTYQAELTTLDNGLQSDTAMATVNVIVGDAPTAVGSAVVTGAAGGPPVYFSAAASDDDFAIVDYRWDFNIEADSDGDGDPGNDIDGVGIAPFHVYDLASDVAGTLFSEPFDGTAIDSNTWLTSGATQDGAMTVTGAGSWGNRYVFSQDDYARGRRSFRGQVTVADGAGSE